MAFVELVAVSLCALLTSPGRNQTKGRVFAFPTSHCVEACRQSGWWPMLREGGGVPSERSRQAIWLHQCLFGVVGFPPSLNDRGPAAINGQN